MENFQTLFDEKKDYIFLFVEKFRSRLFFFKESFTFSLSLIISYACLQHLNNLTSIYVEQIRVCNLNDT